MESVKIEIRNYRSIPLDAPLSLTLKEGIQFIVGVNNVGKSNLLRLFTELREAFYPRQNVQPDSKCFLDIKLPFDLLVNQHFTNDPISLKLTYKTLKETVEIFPTNNEYKHGSSVYLSNSYGNLKTYRKAEESVVISELVRILTKTMYIGTSRVSIPQAAGKHFDFTVGQTFFSNWAVWASGGEREKMKKIELLIEELRELFNYKKLQIQISQGAKEMMITNDEGSFSLEELGSGISHYIFALGGALFNEPSFIFIDEPETGLHPRMQEVFVRALAQKAKYGLIATSHSIGLARSVADEIYMLTREKGKPKLVPFGKHYHTTISQSISEMGFSQFMELGGGNILLVEGRTDIKCFREILRKWGIDKDFIVMSLGGGDFISENKVVEDELNELKRLNAKSISVIFDSERNFKDEKLKKKLDEFKSSCEELGFNVFPTDFHSTENYISQRAINEILGKGYQSLEPYENFNMSARKWAKDKNWLLFREMRKEEFANTELKDFIEKTLVPLTLNDEL